MFLAGIKKVNRTSERHTAWASATIASATAEGEPVEEAATESSESWAFSDALRMIDLALAYGRCCF